MKSPHILAVAAAAVLVSAALALPSLAGPTPFDSTPTVILDADATAERFAREFDRALDAAYAEFDAMIVAHSGQLSKRDNCHRHRKAGERHWHKEGTAERGGPCLEIDGEHHKFTNHAICGKERAAFFKDENDGWSTDHERHAKALRRCIFGLRDFKER